MKLASVLYQMIRTLYRELSELARHTILAWLVAKERIGDEFAEKNARLSEDETTFFYTAKMNPMIGRNYEMLDPLEALARILSVVPPKGWRSVR